MKQNGLRPSEKVVTPIKVVVEEIQIKEGRRELNAVHVRELADSIRELGLLNPITVNKNKMLIAGLHRLEAVKSLGWTDVECTLISLGGLQAELAEIDENFVRSDFTPLEFGEMLLRRKEIYEMLHPEVKAGISQAAGMNQAVGNNVAAKSAATSKSFVQDTSEKLGIAPRTIREQIQTVKNLTPATKQIIKDAETKITHKSALKLSRMEPKQQQKAAKLLASGKIKSTEEYETLERKKPREDSDLAPAVPCAQPPDCRTTLKETIADLKNPDKNCSCTPDMFLAEYSAFVGKFNHEILWYGESQYESACIGLSLAQVEYLRQLTDSVCTSAESLYYQIEKKVST